MEITENARKAIESLRNAPEDQRIFGYAIGNAGKMCACGFLAKPLGIPLTSRISTDYLIQQISEKSEIPVDILNRVPRMNDVSIDRQGWFTPEPKFTFAQIADVLERDIIEWK